MTRTATLVAVLWLIVANPAGAQDAPARRASLKSIFLDRGPELFGMVKKLAEDQAAQKWGMDGGPKYKSTPDLNADPNRVVDQVIFEGVFSPRSNTSKLAIFSDDGCDVWINGEQVLFNYRKGQHLPDTRQSLHPLKVEFAAGKKYAIRIRYGNTIFGGPKDIDGCTLFAYDGGGSTSEPEKPEKPAIVITGANGVGNKKWIVATLPRPHQPPDPNKFSAKQSIVKDGLAVLKYQRGKAQPVDVPAQKDAKIALQFENGLLNYDIQLFDGPQKMPEMSLAGTTITVAGVQQGDKIFVEDMASGAKDHIAVVKNFTWNDFQRNGKKLTFAKPYDSMPADFRDNITKTIAYALDPDKNSAQVKDRIALEKKLAKTYPDKGYCSLPIPSALGIGTLPWDFDHGHLASSAPLPDAFVKKAVAFVDFEIQTGKKLMIVGGLAAPPGQVQTSFLAEADRKKYLAFLEAVQGRYKPFLFDGWALKDPFVVYHTYELEKYEFKGRLTSNDPLRQIRTDKGSAPALVLLFGCQKQGRKSD